MMSTCELAGKIPPAGSFKKPHLTMVELSVATSEAVLAFCFHPLKELLGQVGVRLAVLIGLPSTLNKTISFLPSHEQGPEVDVQPPPETQASTKILCICRHCALSVAEASNKNKDP